MIERIIHHFLLKDNNKKAKQEWWMILSINKKVKTNLKQNLNSR